MNLPQILAISDSRRLAPQSVQLGIVVDAMVDLHVVRVDGPPLRGKQAASPAPDACSGAWIDATPTAFRIRASRPDSYLRDAFRVALRHPGMESALPLT